MSGEDVSARCPDCGKTLGGLTAPSACPGCARAFAPVAGVWNLLPAALHPAKAKEDGIDRRIGLSTSARLFDHKRYWLDWCETRFLPEVVGAGTRTFLEVGGGLCYAGALAKRLGAAHVVATDVSPRYLRDHALEVARILGASANVYAAADAETLPFEDGQFDAVYSQMVLYRLPDPARALLEIRRVLAPGGRYLGIERAWPWAWPFSRRNRRITARALAGGIAEKPMRFRDWHTVLRAAAIAGATLTPVPGRRVRSARLRRLGNAARPIYVAIRMRG